MGKSGFFKKLSFKNILKPLKKKSKDKKAEKDDDTEETQSNTTVDGSEVSSIKSKSFIDSEDSKSTNKTKNDTDTSFYEETFIQEVIETRKPLENKTNLEVKLKYNLDVVKPVKEEEYKVRPLYAGPYDLVQNINDANEKDSNNNDEKLPAIKEENEKLENKGAKLRKRSLSNKRKSQERNSFSENSTTTSIKIDSNFSKSSAIPLVKKVAEEVKAEVKELQKAEEKKQELKNENLTKKPSLTKKEQKKLQKKISYGNFIYQLS